MCPCSWHPTGTERNAAEHLCVLPPLRPGRNPDSHLFVLVFVVVVDGDDREVERYCVKKQILKVMCYIEPIFHDI